MLLAIGAIAAPAVFAGGAGEAAGRIVGRMFSHEAHGGLVAGAALALLVRHRARAAARGEGAPQFSLDLVLALGAIFCTVAGYFALQPMMEAARAGQGRLSFGALHGISAGFFALKGLLVLALAWRLTGTRSVGAA